MYNENIFEQLQAIKTSGLLNATTSTCLENPLCHKKASQEQQCDLLAFRDIGQSEFDKYIDYYILRKSSIQVSQRKRKLSTFGEVKINKRGFSQLQKDMKLVRTCMQKKLLWSKKSKQPVSSVADQYIPLPLAISDNNGLPRKGQKCYTTTTLETRYKCSSPSIFFNSLPLGWKPECCILEGMVMINTTPTGSHTTFEDYGNFLIRESSEM